MPARFINVSGTGGARFINVSGTGRANFSGGSTGTTTTTTTIAMPYYSYGATRCSTGGSVTVISVNSLIRFSTYTTAESGASECYTIQTNATMTADAPTHTFYSTVPNCSDLSCIA